MGAPGGRSASASPARRGGLIDARAGNVYSPPKGLWPEAVSTPRVAKAGEVMGEAYRNLKKQIERALALNARLGADCLGDRQLRGLLLELGQLAERTDSLMVSSGVWAVCGKCAESTGSCCFPEMGESFSAIQLFANLLLGAELPPHYDFPASCYFVSEKGCRLKYRHSFCLNYFCPDLIDILGAQTVLTIQRQVGEQMRAGWDLELALTRYVNSHSIPEHL